MSEQAHATTATYLRIAAILVMITLIEVGIFYVPTFQTILVPLLLVLSAVKFTLVVMFYMHLKFDNRFFTFLFVGSLVIILDVVSSLLFISRRPEHLLLILVFAPLLLDWPPSYCIRPLLRPRCVMAVGRVVTRPLPAALLFTGPIVIWHAPALYEAALRHHNLHILQHLVFLTTAVVMWWPILSPVPELPRIPHLLQMLYL